MMHYLLSIYFNN